MNILHTFSFLFLLIISLFVFFKYIRKLRLSEELLWESFVLSSAVAAFFGMLYFFGVKSFEAPWVFFYRITTVVGYFCLIFALFLLVFDSYYSIFGVIVLLILGFGLYALNVYYPAFDISDILQIVAGASMFMYAFLSFIRKKNSIGAFLLLASLFFVALYYIGSSVCKSNYALDAKLFSWAMVVLFLGMASGYRCTEPLKAL